MPTQASMQVGNIVGLTGFEGGLASLQAIIFGVVLELDARQFDQFLLAVGDQAALRDF